MPKKKASRVRRTRKTRRTRRGDVVIKPFGRGSVSGIGFFGGKGFPKKGRTRKGRSGKKK